MKKFASLAMMRFPGWTRLAAGGAHFQPAPWSAVKSLAGRPPAPEEFP